ncbi:MAG: hypothetical protein KC620_18620, partial [Myxococcales bacterium]|nr:hypothetical protein [Myxococcales bacterium]
GGYIVLQSWRGDYLHRAAEPRVTSWNWTKGSVWKLICLSDGQVRLLSWRDDFLARGPQSTLKVQKSPDGAEWSLVTVDNGVVLRAPDGSYLHRPAGGPQVVVWGDANTKGSTWTILPHARIDVLVLYDEDIPKKLNGNDPKAVLDFIQDTFQQLDEEILPHSGLQEVSLHVVRVQAIAHRSTTLNRAVAQLRDTNDALWKGMNKARTREDGADLVVAFLLDPEQSGHGECGAARDDTPNRYTTRSLGFTAINYRCAIAGSAPYVVAHELGHLMGARHERAHKVPGKFSTLMASPKCDDKAPCPAIPYFSNGAKRIECDAARKAAHEHACQFDGEPLGNNAHDNARTIREGAHEVAHYMPDPGPRPMTCRGAMAVVAGTKPDYWSRSDTAQPGPGSTWVSFRAPQAGRYQVYAVPSGSGQVQVSVHQTCIGDTAGPVVQATKTSSKAMNFDPIQLTAGQTLYVALKVGRAPNNVDVQVTAEH